MIAPLFRTDISECEMTLEGRRLNAAMDTFDTLVSTVISAIHMEEVRRERAVEESVERNALMHLSYPTLGALEGCIRASILAGWCEARVQRLEQTARNAAAVTISNEKAKVKMENGTSLVRTI